MPDDIGSNFSSYTGLFQFRLRWRIHSHRPESGSGSSQTPRNPRALRGRTNPQCDTCLLLRPSPRTSILNHFRPCLSESTCARSLSPHRLESCLRLPHRAADVSYSSGSRSCGSPPPPSRAIPLPYGATALESSPPVFHRASYQPAALPLPHRRCRLATRLCSSSTTFIETIRRSANPGL